MVYAVAPSNTMHTLLIRINKLKHVCGAYTSGAFASVTVYIIPILRKNFQQLKQNYYILLVFQWDFIFHLLRLLWFCTFLILNLVKCIILDLVRVSSKTRKGQTSCLLFVWRPPCFGVPGEMYDDILIRRCWNCVFFHYSRVRGGGGVLI
jgi:hypothetical protein